MNVQDILRFYSKSADTPAGYGTGETYAENSPNRSLFAELPLNFRKILSNFFVSVFTFDFYGVVGFDPLPGDTTFKSIEHAFQAAKFLLAAQVCRGSDPARYAVFTEAAIRFTVNSGDAIGQGDGALAQKNRKLIKLRPHEITAWNGCSERVMTVISGAAFVQCPIRRAVLLNTGDAELWHIRPRMTPVRFWHLEEIRAHLSEEPLAKRAKA